MEPATPSAGSSKARTLRPFVWWIVVSALLLTWRHHQQEERRATIQFTVSVEGREERPEYRAELNDLSFEAGGHSGLWLKRLTIEARDADTFTTNFFVWYGGKDLGGITLVRSRGTLDLSLRPPAVRVSVEGAEAKQDFHDAAHESVSLPTGRYKVTAAFARFATNTEIEIVTHRTSFLPIDPGITALRLTSQPTNAEFELNSLAVPKVSIRSNTPVTLTDLPSGDYQLRIWRDDYRKTVSCKLNPARFMNELTVEFDYAKLTLSSEPSNAVIRIDDKFIGRTPTEVTLPTGVHLLMFSKEEFRDTNVSLTLYANEKRTVAVSLISAAYADAVDNARYYSTGSSPDFERALDEVNKALQIKPGDEDARKLKQVIEFKRHLYQAKAFEREKNYSNALAEIDAALKFDPTDTEALTLKTSLQAAKERAEQAAVEARRDAPRKLLDETVSHVRYQELFPTETMHFDGAIDNVRDSVIRALGRKPEWSVSKNQKMDDSALLIYAELKGLGSRQKLFLTLGQTTDMEVTICFKLFEYTLDENVHLSLTGISEDSYKPLHTQHVAGVRSLFVQRQRAGDLQELRKRIQDELH